MWRLAVLTVSALACTSCAAYVWGENTDGQLGLGTSGSTADEIAPVEMTGGPGVWESLSAGQNHSCGVAANASLWCWGENVSGQVGNGVTAPGLPQATPVQVGAATDWRLSTAGGSHSCAVMDDSTLWCWGNGFSGQLGTGPLFGQESSPVDVSTGVSTVSAGGDHTCAIADSGELSCWGTGSSGQLGVGLGCPPDVDDDFTVCGDVTSPPTAVGAPAQVGTAANWEWIDLGKQHTCGIRNPGILWCWGLNNQGRLGDDTTIERSSPTAVFTGFVDWASVSAGDHHTCAIRNSGYLYCWGRNDKGQLGTGDLTEYHTPQPIGNDFWREVSAGGDHTCGIQEDNSLWCWGDNGAGQLGDDTGVDRNVPTAVATTAVWHGVSAGAKHTLATVRPE